MKKHLLTSLLVPLLILTASCAYATSKITSSFTDIPIDVGKNVWYSSVVRVRGAPTYPLVIYCTNQHINSEFFSHTVPNAVLILDPAVTVASTIFNGTAWVTTARPNEQGNYFLSGYVDSMTELLPDCQADIAWTGDITASRKGVTLSWQMSAAVYSSMSSNLNSLGVKPSDCSSCSLYQLPHKAGTPESHIGFVIDKTIGTGAFDYTGKLSDEVMVYPELAHGNITLCEGNNTTIKPGTICSGWNSSQPAIASVSEDGIVTGEAAGTAVISYILKGYPIWQTVTVTVNAMPEITPIARPPLLFAGATLLLNARTSVDGGFSNDAAFSWYGPDGFMSASRLTFRPDMNINMDGVYHLKVTDHGCTATAKTNALRFKRLPGALVANLKRLRIPRANYLTGGLVAGDYHRLIWDLAKPAHNKYKKPWRRRTAEALAIVSAHRLRVKRASFDADIRGIINISLVTERSSKRGHGTKQVPGINTGVDLEQAKEVGLLAAKTTTPPPSEPTTTTGALATNSAESSCGTDNSSDKPRGNDVRSNALAAHHSSAKPVWHGYVDVPIGMQYTKAVATADMFATEGHSLATAIVTANSQKADDAIPMQLLADTGPSSFVPDDNNKVYARISDALNATSRHVLLYASAGIRHVHRPAQNQTKTATYSSLCALEVSRCSSDGSPPTVMGTAHSPPAVRIASTSNMLCYSRGRLG